MPGIIILCWGYVFSQFFRAFLAVMTPVLGAELGMTATEFAYASGAWFVAFAVFQFPVGMMLDSIGPKLTAASLFTVFGGGGVFLFAFAHNPTTIIIAMAMIGIGCSAALMAPFYIFMREHSPAQFALMSSIFVGIGSLGNIASSEPLAAAIEAFGWRESSIALGIGTVLVGIGIYLLVHDPKKIEKKEIDGGYGELFRLKELWPIFPMILAGYVVVAGIRGSWIGPMHADLYGYDTLQIGRATLWMSIALVLGTLCYGPLDRIFNTRKYLVLGGNVIMLVVCILLAVHIPEDPFWMLVAIVVMSFFCANYTIQMAHGKSFLPDHLAGRGVTTLNFCAIGGAGFFQWISGPIVSSNVVAGQPETQYQVLFIFYTIVVGIALVIYTFSKDAKPNL